MTHTQKAKSLRDKFQHRAFDVVDEILNALDYKVSQSVIDYWLDVRLALERL